MLFQSALFWIQWPESQTGKNRSVMIFQVGDIKLCCSPASILPTPVNSLTYPAAPPGCNQFRKTSSNEEQRMYWYHPLILPLSELDSNFRAWLSGKEFSEWPTLFCLTLWVSTAAPKFLVFTSISFTCCSTLIQVKNSDLSPKFCNI